MARAKARGVPFFGVSLSRKEVEWDEESLQDIASFIISVAIFRLNAGLRREFQLHKGVADVVVLVGVCSKSARLIVKAAKAEG